MSEFRRSVFALILAAALPVALIAAYFIANATRDDRRDIERATMARTLAMQLDIDARMLAAIRGLQVLAASASLERGDIAAFAAEAPRIAAGLDGWVAVALTDASTGALLAGAAPIVEPDSEAEARDTRRPVVGGLGRVAAPGGGERRVAVVRVPVVRDGVARYVLSAGIDPRIVQRVMLFYLRGDTVAGVVDRRGRFLARSLDYEKRLGTPATEYVHAAIASGEAQAIYRGVTFEGLENYTAFVRSDLSGWSSHVALNAALIDVPISRSSLGAALAGLGGLLLGGALIFLVVRDMAHRRRTEHAMNRMQRLEALGRMTGGIAHDFNNLLAIIIGNVGMLRRRAAGKPLPPQLEAIELAAERGAKLVQRLLAYSRQQPLEPEVIDLNHALANMMPLIRQLMRDDVAVEVDLKDGLWPIRVDATQLETAILNVASNAREAMPAGGRLRLSTRNVPGSGEAGADEVALAISDSGEGIPPEVIDRVFDPFFTTRGESGGTGLGLSMVYGFAEQSGGNVSAESQPGRGATIVLRFPRSLAAQPVALARAAAPPRAAAAGTGRILVVEDDADVALMASEALTELGYTTRCTATAAEALALLAGRFAADLVLTDLAMPGMDGLEFAREVRRLYPGTPVILTSGYAEGLTDADRAEFAVLSKPYLLDALATAVQKGLTETPQRAALSA